MAAVLWLLGAALCVGIGFDIGKARERHKARTRPVRPIRQDGPDREPPTDLFREMVVGEDGKPITVAPPKRARDR
jgi:hypothetical protein